MPRIKCKCVRRCEKGIQFGYVLCMKLFKWENKQVNEYNITETWNRIFFFFLTPTHFLYCQLMKLNWVKHIHLFLFIAHIYFAHGETKWYKMVESNLQDKINFYLVCLRVQQEINTVFARWIFDDFIVLNIFFSLLSAHADNKYIYLVWSEGTFNYELKK